jgi:hypothetical protein
MNPSSGFAGELFDRNPAGAWRFRARLSLNGIHWIAAGHELDGDLPLRYEGSPAVYLVTAVYSAAVYGFTECENTKRES